MQRFFETAINRTKQTLTALFEGTADILFPDRDYGVDFVKYAGFATVLLISSLERDQENNQGNVSHNTLLAIGVVTLVFGAVVAKERMEARRENNHRIMPV